jgi:S-DNA-T family DNA segregation ATPase FtsK/SpoIIIE
LAQTTKKKTTAKSSSSKKNTKGNAKKKSGQMTLSDVIFRQEFKATVIFVFGLLLAVVMLFAGGDGSFWNRIHVFYFSVTGVCGYYIPPAILFFGVVNVMNRQNSTYYFKALELFFLLLLICGLVHINRVADPAVPYGDAIGNVYRDVIEHRSSAVTNGGVFGAVVGGALFAISKSKLVANIISAMLIIADLMLLFGITLFRLFSEMEKPARKVSAATNEAIEKRRSEYEKIKEERRQRKNPDVDPALIVDDFYQNNPEAAAGLPGREKKQPRKKPEPVKEEAPVQEDIFSSFETLGEFPIHKPKEPAREAGDHTAEAEPAPTPSFMSIFPTQEQPAPAGEAEEPKEKLPPLTKKEASELNDMLDSAVAETAPVVYHMPPLDCLSRPVLNHKGYNEAELKSNGEKLIAALNSFNVSATIVGVVPGPTVTRYELSPAPGVKISKFVGLSDDLALHMAAPAGLRIEAPIPNKAAIGIEIPNKNKTSVTFREVIDVPEFRDAKSKLTVALGKDISGNVIFCDIASMPHLLVAGTTGSGKSICLHTMIASILYKATPDEVKLLLIDPKTVEFSRYNGIPHLLVPVVSDPRKASGALGWAVTEMLSRYKTLNENGARDIGSYNSLCEGREDLKKMAQIVIVMDELADLMTVAPAEVEDSIQRIAQMGRAAGMHLVVATQRPSVDVITGVIKANIPSRIALTVKSQVDSRTMIDQAGAEKLMGKGDMLYFPVSVPKPIRVQGAFISPTECDNVVDFIKANGTAQYDDNVQQEIERQAAADKKKGGSDADAGGGVDAGDDLLMRAIELFVNTPEKASISALQRHLSLGFAKAGRLMDTLEEKGIVGPHEGSKPRKVLVTKAQWYEMNAMSDNPVTAASDTPVDPPFDADDAD